MIALLREAGGFGDIMCASAAARALRHDVGTEEIALCVPENFAEFASHLEGPDRVVSLGPLSEIRPVRRRRDTPMDPNRHPYLQKVFSLPNLQRVIDLYCPAFLNETTTSGEPQYSRSQLFAMAAGATHCLDAKPVWRLSDTDRNMARKILCGYQRPYLVCQMRATCTARSLTSQQSEGLIGYLTQLGTVFYADCCAPQHPVDSKAVGLINLPWPVLAAVISFSDLVVCVDSALLHLAAATGTPAVALFGPSSGEAVTASYLQIWPLDGSSDQCSKPCCYTTELGWDRIRCRSAGCCRMMSHDAKAVAAGVRVALEFARAGRPSGAEVPASKDLACVAHRKGGFSGP